MEKRPRPIWLFMQGYHASSLPPMVIWYGKGKSFRAMADDYTIGLYRNKGYVLDERFLDPSLWENLEYSTDKRAAVVEEPQKRPSPLVRKVITTMGDRAVWEGSSEELLGLIHAGPGIPKTGVGLTRKLVSPSMVDALGACGIAVENPRTKHNRLIRLSRITK